MSHYTFVVKNQVRLLSHGTSSLRKSLRLSKRRIYHGITYAVASVVFGAVLTYKEIRKLERRLQLPDAASSLEKKYNYISINNNPHDEESSQKNKRWKKIKHRTGFWLPLWRLKTARSHDPATLLLLARSQDPSVRQLAVRALANQPQWTDVEYEAVARSLDPATLVGLARTEAADPRFFLPQPRLPDDQVDLEERLRRLLTSLPRQGINMCTQYFIDSALQVASGGKGEDRGGVWSFDGNGILVERSIRTLPPDVRVELFTLEALLDYAKLARHCPSVVRHNGLDSLQRILESRPGNLRMHRSIARILANLAVYDSLHTDIISAGWVSVLSQWQRSADLALSLEATRALANLDAEPAFSGKTGPKYMDGVYLYHPQYREPNQPVTADIVFVHGLLGGPFRTWRQRDRPQLPAKSPNAATANSGDDKQAVVCTNCGEKHNKQPPPAESPSAEMECESICGEIETVGGEAVTTETEGVRDCGNEEPYTHCWPKDWLGRDLPPGVRILTVEYESHLSEWSPRCPYQREKRALSQRSHEMLHKLRRAGVGDRPVIWVGHSMGGLLIKRMLTLASREDSVYGQVASNTRGIVFYSVPHHGSPLAARNSHYFIYPSVEVKELKKGSSHLSELHREFREFMFESGVPLLSFAEGEKTRLPFNIQILLVPPDTSDPGFGEFHMMENLSHLTICKPESRDSELYQLTLEFLRDCVPDDIVQHIIQANVPDEYVLDDFVIH